MRASLLSDLEPKNNSDIANRSTVLSLFFDANSRQDSKGKSLSSGGMENDAFEIARQRLVTACEITGLRPTALAKAAGVAVTTVTRPINRKADSAPSARTMLQIERVVRDAIAQMPPAQANEALGRWEGERTHSAPSIYLDEEIFRRAIAITRHEMRHAWEDISPEILGDVILGVYKEIIAERDANCEPESGE